MNSHRLTVTLLGTGTSTGVPMAGCPCPVCTSPLPENQRSRCSALLNYRNRNILIDPCTDFRQQALREKIPGIDAVLLTHTHADHIHGIDDLRAFNPPDGESIPVFGSRESLDHLRGAFRYIFSDGDASGYRPRLTVHAVTDSFPLFGLRVEPIPLIHGTGRSLGFRIGPFAYLTDCSAIPQDSAPKLLKLDVLVLDALRFRPHFSHFNIPQAIETAQGLGARRTLLTHLSHEVEHRRDSQNLPPGIELAWDGLRLEFALTS